MQFNKRVNDIKVSYIRRFNDFAKANGAKYFLTLGEPDFTTPDSVKNKVKEALDNNLTNYAPIVGYESTRQAICKYEKDKNNILYSPSNIIITQGSTEAFAIALFSIINEGDEIIVPIPGYPLYRQLGEFFGAKIITIDISKSNFQITKEQLENAISEKTKAIVITNPNNPTGVILNDESIQNIHDALVSKDIFILCDDVYNQIVYNKSYKKLTDYDDLFDQRIILQSFSKTYAMPGWRVGYLAASEEVVKQATKLHQYILSCINSFIQPAMEEAINIDYSYMVESYKERRDYVYDRLIKMGLDVIKPEGAFYIFPSIKEFNMSSWDFCKEFVLRYKTALIPGISFEGDDYVRLSYCVDKDTIKIALDNLEQFVNELRKKPFIE